MMNKNTSFLLLLLIPGAGVSLLLFFDWRQLTPENIRNVVLSFGVWAPLLYLLLHLIRPLVFFPAVVLALASGITFGPWWGTLLDAVGASAGAVIAFLLARRLGRETVRRWLGKRLAAWDERSEDYGFRTIFLMRLIPVLPFDAVNYGAGLSRVRFRDYLFATCLGAIPGAFAYNYLGHSLHNIFSPVFFAAVAGVLLLALIPLLLRRSRRGREAALPARRRPVKDD